MKLQVGTVILSAVVLVALAGKPASADHITVNLEEVVSEGLTAPLALRQPPGDDRRFIIEQIGTIRILTADGELLPQPFLNIRHKISTLIPDFDERGLLGLAFHPDFQENGRFYVYYSSAHISGDADFERHVWWSHTNTVAEYQVSADDPDRADPLTERILLRIDWPQFNHNGGWIDFGPDGYLYISTGDGGYANDWGIGHHVTMGNGQYMGTHKGKMLRIDVDGEHPYGIPEDNPFTGEPDAEPEIWALGLRNPWRCSFDMGGDNELFCADVGQNSYEIVNIITSGGNYGWRVKEGTHCFDYVNPNDHPAECDDEGMIDPILEYNNCNVHADCRGLSVTGGYVYRGNHADWDGVYFFGDWSSRFDVRDGRLFAGVRNGESWEIHDVEVANMPRFNSYVLAFGQDSDGEIYVMASDTTGPVGGLDKIYKIVP